MVVTEAYAGKSPINILTSLGEINIGFGKETHFIPMVNSFGNDEIIKVIQAGLPGQTADVFVYEAGEHDEVFFE